MPYISSNGGKGLSYFEGGREKKGNGLLLVKEEVRRRVMVCCW